MHRACAKGGPLTRDRAALQSSPAAGVDFYPVIQPDSARILAMLTELRADDAPSAER